MLELQWYVVLAAFILDFFLGDPEMFPHPVVYMGRAIDFFEAWFRKKSKDLFVSGFFFACFLILSTWVLAFITLYLSMALNPVFGCFVQIMGLFFCFSSSGLEKAALKVFHALDQNNIEKARSELSLIIGRQTQTMDKSAVTRAAVETVSENFVDGFLSPLIFAMIGGVPLALAYKMVNTLDSMVGYKNDKYRLFGRVAARIDDAANFIPARLSVVIISAGTAFFSIRKAWSALKTGVLQGSFNKSPNAGYPEACFAGALEIRVGGPGIYNGIKVEKPYIGKEFKDPGKIKIKQACDLMMLSSLLSVLIACSVLFGVHC